VVEFAREFAVGANAAGGRFNLVKRYEFKPHEYMFELTILLDGGHSVSGFNFHYPYGVADIIGFRVACSPSSDPGDTILAAFNSLTANGSSTTKLTLTFGSDIAGLTASDITLTANGTGAVKGALTKTGTGIYELTVSGITSVGLVTVGVAKAGYVNTPGSRQVMVYSTGSANIKVTFSNLPSDETFNGFSGGSSELSWKLNTPLTISVPTGSFAEYSWYLDNHIISGAASNTLTMTARDFEIGSRTITLKVKTSGDKYYSKTVNFTVISGL
jgi:hypothetical protein